MANVIENYTRFEVHAVVTFLQLNGVIQIKIYGRLTSVNSQNVSSWKEFKNWATAENITTMFLGFWWPPVVWISSTKTTINTDSYCEILEEMWETIGLEETRTINCWSEASAWWSRTSLFIPDSSLVAKMEVEVMPRIGFEDQNTLQKTVVTSLHLEMNTTVKEYWNT
jgi:hypothetical protein